MLVAFTVLMCVGFVGIAFFIRSREVLQVQLKDRLRSTAAVAALQFEGEELDRFRTPEDMQSVEFGMFVEKLRRIRAEIPDVRFAYILRSTNDPMTVEFVADADNFGTLEELDRNGNGTVDDDEEASLPGDAYDVTEIPALQSEAFDHPTTDDDLTFDQWGTLISGYAPIRDARGKVHGVLGIDMRAEDYFKISYSIFSPVNLLFLLLVGVFIALWILRMGWRRQVAMLQRINHERTNLLRLTYHQLGGPLTILKWALEEMEEVKDNEQTCLEMLPQFRRSTKEGISRINGIVDALESAEQVELGLLQYRAEQAVFRSLLEQVVKDLESGFHSKQMKVAINCPQDLSFAFDKALIQTVMRKILENTVDYSDKGGQVTIHVECDHRRATIAISDTGCGIPKAELPHVTEKYTRGSNAGVHQPNGNGLSLYIVKGIVEGAGGSMAIDSTEGKGTTVTIVLPLQ